MASHQDLLDAIARVRAATGSRVAWQNGLSGDDIAVACSAWSAPSALGAVLSKIVAAHPDAFLVDSGPVAPPPRPNEGLAADAIRGAETALARQNSTAAQVDLQVVTAVLNAHAANADGAAELESLQTDIESAVLSRTDLDTPAGAREFQRFLIGKLRDIRTVVDTAGLDATSKAALAAALASLYASATPPPVEPAVPDQAASTYAPAGPGSQETPPAQARGSAGARPEPASTAGSSRQFDDLPPIDLSDIPSGSGPAFEPLPVSAPPPSSMPAPVMAAPATAPAGPAWGGGGLPAGIPFGGGGLASPTLPELAGPDPLTDRLFEDRDDHVDPPDRADESRVEPETESEAEEEPGEATAETDAPADGVRPEDPTTVHLPDGGNVSAPSAEVAAAMTAAIAGTPIPEAFRLQGITLPAPGTAVTAPVQVTDVIPGDIGMFADRHALALGNGEALLDGQIQPIASVIETGFLGWQHPPVPGPTTTEQPPTPDVPAPNRPAETAPS